MNTKRQFLSTLVIGLVVAGVILAAMAVWSSGASRGIGQARAERVQAAPVEAVVLDSVYAGYVKLDWALPGVYSDALSAPPPPTPDLGSIDLGLLLHGSGDSVTGYVDLTNTLVFSVEHTITATLPGTTTQLAVGPYMSGTLDGANLHLESERLVQVTGAKQRLMRQFRLIGAPVAGDMNTLAGQYRETLWGYGPQPLTIVGTFTLTLTSGTPVNLSQRVYLPLILR
jgi:hypothetical protein